MVHFFKHGNEPSGYVTRRNFFHSIAASILVCIWEVLRWNIGPRLVNVTVVFREFSDTNGGTVL
jgi:hypothetical protein